MKKALKYLVFVCLSSLLFISCNKSKIYEQRQEFDNNTWERLTDKKTIKFDNINIEKTDDVYDIYVTLRHTPYINEKQVKFVMKIISPSGIVKETVHTIKLSDRFGTKWVGDAMGDMIDVEEKCRSFVSFPEKGNYTITLTNLGTYDKTVGLMDMGIRIEKSDLDYNVTK
jgi:gliding motility-associated lipoprotein GldH